jgi:acyl-CoA thioester hydrolase
MIAVFEWSHKVEAVEVDELGHANNLACLRWMNAAAVAHSAALGWPMENYFKQGHGWVVRRHEVEYLRPAPPDAAIIVRTWVQTVERASSWRCYEVRLGGSEQVIARGRTLWAWVDYRTGRPARIPATVAAAFPVVGRNVFEKLPQTED